MRGRLNLFQASMVRWREVHPYNGVHVIRIGKALAVAELQHAIVITSYSIHYTKLYDNSLPSIDSTPVPRRSILISLASLSPIS